jgi:hypothetical protein
LLIVNQERDPDELKATAYHEAGHVVMQRVFGLDLVCCTLEAEIHEDGKRWIPGKTRGPTILPPEAKPRVEQSDDYRQSVSIYLLVTIAGSVAHRLIDPAHEDDEGDLSDYQRVKEAIDSHVRQVRFNTDEIFENVDTLAIEILEKHKHDVAIPLGHHVLNLLERTYSAIVT